ncbi:MAG: BrnT family toxin [Pirellulales bacterium]
MLFEWDVAKARSNEGKHGVTFSEAASVFADPLAALFDDVEHSDQELREIIVGDSEKQRLLVVSYSVDGDIIRIISARLATRRERKDYEESPLGGWKDE